MTDSHESVGTNVAPLAHTPSRGPAFPDSLELGEELDRIETAERQERDRQRELELARLRELARYD